MNTSTSENNGFQIQEVLSLGYVYLLILGIIHNAIYYNLLGVNYLEYSSILDVLISPVSVITSSLKSSIAFVAIIILSFIYVKILIPLLVKWRKKQKKYQEGKPLEKIQKLDEFSKNSYALLVIIALFVFGYFIGFGYGSGTKNKKLISENDIKHNYQIDFINGNSLEAKLLGKNSLNVFYIQKNEKTVTISPIEGNIESFKKLKP
jgi:ABC-type Fe3+ transport system permease subunit